jgi:hypothetical protein
MLTRVIFPAVRLFLASIPRPSLFLRFVLLLTACRFGRKVLRARPSFSAHSSASFACKFLRSEASSSMVLAKMGCNT